MHEHNNRVINLEDPKSSIKKQTNTIPTPVVSMGDLLIVDYPENEDEIQRRIKMEGFTKICKIDLTKELEPPPVAMQIMSEGSPMTMFSKGNFSIITGKAKSRKTFLTSMLIAAAVKGNLQDKFICEGEGVNILFDTEQSSSKTQEITNRICHLSERIYPANLNTYSLRTLDPVDRLDYIDYILSITPFIKFVAIDGIIDLADDPILQADQAQKIIQKLMYWTEIYNIHITCVLHYNKTVSTLLGHLGSISHRKADAIIEVAMQGEGSNVSLVKAINCREQEFAPFAFSINPNGIPYVLDDFEFTKKKPDKEPKVLKPPALLPCNLAPDKHAEILTTVFKIYKEQGYKDLWQNVKFACGQIGIVFGNNKAIEFVTYYLHIESIIKSNLPNKKDPVYTLAGQRIIEFN